MNFRLFVGLFASMGFFGMINMGTYGMDKNVSNMSDFSENNYKNISSVEITDMNQFRTLTDNRSGILQSVTFLGMEVNKEFTDLFWDRFIDGVDTLKFENCSLAKGYRFCDLFDKFYILTSLRIHSNDLDIDDVRNIISKLYLDPVDNLDFDSNQVNKKDVQQIIIDILGPWALYKVES